jgi:predicted site-specific integrase-resolvase
MAALDTELLYTGRETARMLKISEPTLATWRKKGLIPCVWIGYVVRYEPERVLAALRKIKREEVTK